MTRRHSLSQARILVVDDEFANVRLLERLLLTGGYSEVRTTMDPRETMDLIDSFTPDLVMLDLNMPGMDGFAVLKAIREHRAGKEYLPVLVLTADMTQATKERALADGANDFLAKPFERTEVLLRTRNLIDTRYLHLALKDENRTLEAKLTYQAFHDSLTGLPNRALFRDRVEHALARAARGARSALLFLDLDDFKTVNDTLGHGAGDRLLQVVGGRLQAAVRGCDTVSRLGGDEFAVLLDNIQHDEDATVVVERILETFRIPIDLDARELMVSASIGVAHARAEDVVDELLRNADVAMYRAKAAGKGQSVTFEPSMFTDLIERLELANDLHLAVGRGELRILYQPILDLESGSVTGVEALLRWQREANDETSPADFIPLAEETGSIVPIGRWVMTEACRQVRAWQLSSPANADLMVCVNVSGRQLHEQKFAADVAMILADTGLAPDRLVLEITESVFVSNFEAATRLEELKALGVQIAIDDFGTGYSNLSYLQRFPIDVIKIDRSFVARVSEGESSFASMILSLASALKLRTVAEGIEEHSQRDALTTMGCASGQGYLFSHPVTAREIPMLLSLVVPKAVLPQ